MSKRPVLLLAAMFCVGILSGEVKAAIVLAGFLLIYAKPWKEKGIRKAVFAAGLPLLFFLGMFCMCRESTFRQNYLDRMQDEQRVRLAGRVTRIEEKARCFYYYLTDCTISLSGQHMQTNDVIAYVSSDEYSIGQILTIEGTISLFDVATNEGAFDARQFYRSQKIDFGIWVERVIAVCGKPDRYRMFLENIRQRLKNNIESSMKDGGVLSAMILGEKSGLDAEVKSLYQKAGISHILAISGLHVSFLGMGLYRILRYRLRRTYWMSAATTAVVMLSYAIMTGNGVSTLRAVGMLCIYLIADILGQNYDMLSALGAMILVLLWKNPFLIGYNGFVFSVAAVLGVGAGQEVILKYVKVCTGKQKEERKAENVLKQKWKEQREGLWISLSIQLFTLPLVAYHYYEIPVYAMILNLFVLAMVKYLMELGVLGQSADCCPVESQNGFLFHADGFCGDMRNCAGFLSSFRGAVYYRKAGYVADDYILYRACCCSICIIPEIAISRSAACKRAIWKTKADRGSIYFRAVCNVVSCAGLATEEEF